MSRQISIQIPSRSGSPASATASSQKSNLQLQLADILVRVTGSTTTTNSSEGEEEEDDYDDGDDACSSYDEDEHEDDELPEAVAASSSPDLYAEFAVLNPYASAAASSQRNPSGPAARVVCQTVEVLPARAESHDEALTRLSSQLDSVHSVIRAEEAAALRFLRTLALAEEAAI
ncbi:hypothetical protein F5X96DRAFT_673903 [Biscogniauxia mediterranea]|nr:hypothetical protein F5X96DRAFT_673903 [Biscogniauxia mediterranea]